MGLTTRFAGSVRFYANIESRHKNLNFVRALCVGWFAVLLPLVLPISPGKPGVKYAVCESNSEPFSRFAQVAPASVVRISQPSSTAAITSSGLTARARLLNRVLSALSGRCSHDQKGEER